MGTHLKGAVSNSLLLCKIICCSLHLSDEYPWAIYWKNPGRQGMPFTPFVLGVLPAYGHCEVSLWKVIQGQQFLSQFWTAWMVQWNTKFGARVGGTWKNRYSDPFWFQPNAFQSSPVPAEFCRGPFNFAAELNQKVELEWKRRYSAGIRKEPGCLFLFVACTIVPKRYTLRGDTSIFRHF